MKYFYLCPVDNGENVSLHRESHYMLNARAGEILDSNVGEEQFSYTLKAGESYGYEQFDPDWDGTLEELSLNQRLLDYYDHDLIMSRRLIDSILKITSTNLQTYPVTIKNTFNNDEIESNYLFVNISKSFLCEEIQKKVSSKITNDPTELSIDESKTKGHKIFRLRNFGTIIVDKDIAKEINNGDFKGVIALPLGD